MNFKKLKQLSIDIDLLEQSGKYTAAEVLHKKFIKEAQSVQEKPTREERYQATPSQVQQRTLYPGQGNYVERGVDFARSVRNNEGTLYNFQGLDPQMELATVPGVPGSPKRVLIPRGSDPRMADPAFQASQRIKAFENATPGYSEFLKLKPQTYQIREFVDAKGTSTDAGMAIYNELMASQSGRSIAPAPTTVPAATGPASTPGFDLSRTPLPQSVNDARFLVTPKLNLNKTPTVTPTATPTSPQSTNLDDGLTVNKGNIIYPEDTANQNANQLLQESKAKMPERIQYYDKKIQEMNDQTNPQVKENMRKTLKDYISNNHSTGILDTNSYSRFMNALGENSGYS